MGRRSSGSAMAAVLAILASCLVFLVGASSGSAEGGFLGPETRPLPGHDCREMKLTRLRDPAGGRTSPLVRGALLQVPAQLAIFPLDTFKTRLQIPFGAPGAYQGSDRAFAVRRVNALQVPCLLRSVSFFCRHFLTAVHVFSAAALLVGGRSVAGQPAADALDCVQRVRTSKR
jgi:hypothetical protein